MSLPSIVPQFAWTIDSLVLLQDLHIMLVTSLHSSQRWNSCISSPQVLQESIRIYTKITNSTY